ncbi:cell division protein FtsK [Enterococcus casseliflavus]|jgi:hypothetical protein|uniref:cell division protein FtsK n=1 Tax=Enterococcus casseliflavus TaxID=37734 RepID=UPI0022DFA75C|nr:cell division protein FtsK [Enterococcus casseliflavus]
MRKYRRIVRNEKSVPQGYQIFLVAFGIATALTLLSVFTGHFTAMIEGVALFQRYLEALTLWLGGFSALSLLLVFFFYTKQEEVSCFDIPVMSHSGKKLAKKILRLFNDKQIVDVLKLSNATRYGDEMPEIYVWVDDDCTNGYIAIENIGNYERLDREKYEQKLSGILSGQMKRFAVVSSELVQGDTYMIFYVEDTLTSNRIHIKEGIASLEEYLSDDEHSIRLSKDLVWNSDITPHMSIIARTRAGKSVLAGRYMASLMIFQGWTVEYNSAKYDRYVKQFDGKSTAIEIVERAEHWVAVMQNRLNEVNAKGQEKYLDMVGMNDIAIFFDELGNLNAELEMDKSLKKRWETAINKLTATGGSAGIHVIAISQFATKEGFLPSLARVNCSDAVIMLGGAADSGDERRYLMSGFADMPKRSYGKGQGVARFVSSGKKWETPHFYETPWFDE